jgi:hypothetical protein
MHKGLSPLDSMWHAMSEDLNEVRQERRLEDDFTEEFKPASPKR